MLQQLLQQGGRRGKISHVRNFSGKASREKISREKFSRGAAPFFRGASTAPARQPKSLPTGALLLKTLNISAAKRQITLFFRTFGLLIQEA
ncbi:MAG: hypothetical protein K6D55_10240 [Prevotella sp.]|nr:hypothetical protein [Prevotella sp.]